MKWLVCGGRNFGHVIRTTGNTDDEPEDVKAKLAEYEFIHKFLHSLTLLYSTEYNPDDNWLPTDIEIIEGGAKGADSAAADFAIVNYTKLTEVKADWEKYGKAAGMIRNRQMIDLKPDLVIAFPGGIGTANMVTIARMNGVEVMEVPYYGRPTEQNEAKSTEKA